MILARYPTDLADIAPVGISEIPAHFVLKGELPRMVWKTNSSGQLVFTKNFMIRGLRATKFRIWVQASCVSAHPFAARVRSERAKACFVGGTRVKMTMARKGRRTDAPSTRTDFRASP